MFNLRRKSRAMIDTVGGLRALMKWDSHRADNFVFRLHYKVTFGVIIICFFIVSAKLYAGDPIDCVTSPAVERLIDQYCWIHSTYTVMRPDKYGRLTYFAGEDPPPSEPKGDSDSTGLSSSGRSSYPGVHGVRRRDRLLHHRYYQWVWFVLFLQALSFYIPKYVWKIWEAGRLRTLVGGLADPCEDSNVELQKDSMIEYFLSQRWAWGTSYAYKFYFCELLNCLNVGVQLVLMDAFFGHAPSSFGFDLFVVTNEDPYRRTDPLAVIFPKVTKCTFNAHGIGGSIVSHDAICVLSINNINEKMYVFLCFWFLVLLVISVFGLILRLLTLCSWRVRFMSLSVNYGACSTSSALRSLVRQFEASDWFVLSEISKHVNPSLFAGIVKELAERIGTQKDVNGRGRRKGTHV